MAPSKPLAAVAGAPLIEHVIRLAAAGGATEFIVVTGYEAEGVEAFLEKLQGRLRLKVTCVRNLDWARPNGVSVLRAAEALGDDPFILLMSDHLFDPDILRRLVAALRSDAALTLGADYRVDRPDLDLDDATKIKLGAEARIVGIGKALDDYDAVDTGIFVAGPDLLAALLLSIESGGSGSLSEGVAKLADAGAAFTFDIGDGWWVDVDDEPAFRRAERELPARLAGLEQGSA
ncbi:NTP transferase domain-containing protein [Sphingosinicella sp. BN140058]|uniref:phosphocholine cytidylyltransferase family protein n=1 Tax=Sphingosinicella sp. BN140058 TaxID=1892855 RepID=UPI001FB11EAC|nr:NTP transferase domain-containing protein [Sphingosinicella sp. BN140058]